MPDPLSFKIKKHFDRYIHDPIAATIAIPLFLTLKLLPYKFSSYLCGALVYLIAPLTSYNKRVKRHLKIVFPNKSKKEINQLTSQHWFMLGQTIGEMPHINNLINFDLKLHPQLFFQTILYDQVYQIVLGPHFLKSIHKKAYILQLHNNLLA